MPAANPIARVRRRIASVREHGFFSSVAVLASGTAAAQVVNVVVAPILTRLYTPADLGRIGLYLAFANLATVILVLRLETALPSGRTDREAAQLAVVALVVLPVTAVGSAFVFWLLVRASISGFGELPEASALAMVLTLVLVGAQATNRYWLTRLRRFGPVSRGIVWQSITRAGVQLALGSAGAGWVGLLAADLTGDASGAGVIGRAAIGDIRRLAGAVRDVPAKSLLRLYWRFPVLSLPSSFLDALAAALPVPLIAHFYGVDAAGHFVLIQLVLGLPGVVVGTSVADAFHGRMAELARDTPDLAMGFLFRTGLALFATGLPIIVGIMVLGPLLFGVLFGVAWAPAGLLAAIMAPSALASLVVSPLSRTVFIYQGQRLKLAYDALDLVLVAGSVGWAAAMGWSVTGAVAALSVAVTVSYVVYLLVIVHLVGRGTSGSTMLPASSVPGSGED